VENAYGTCSVQSRFKFERITIGESTKKMKIFVLKNIKIPTVFVPKNAKIAPKLYIMKTLTL
jgi:hypothetical protein